MPVSIRLPSYLTTRSASDAVSVCCKILHADGDIVIDASALEFVDPFGMATLGVVLHDKQNQGDRVSVSGMNTDSGHYLRRMDVFQGVTFLERLPELQRHNRNDSLVELTSIDKAGDVGNVSRRLSHAIVGVFPGIDPDEPPDEMTGYTTFERLVEPLQYVLSELLENALTHARGQGYQTSKVWVAAQFFPSNDLVRMAVVDNGCGFLTSLREHPELSTESHLAAILLALRPRISCNRDLGILNSSANQGVGLTTAMRIAQRAGGGMVIVSGNAAHDIEGSSSAWNRRLGWQGVAIGIEMRRDHLKDVRFRELLPKLEDTPLPPLRFE